MNWLPSIPYPPAKEGYWSPVTSTLNWCEEDYYLSPYSAEIVNTFTNLTFIYLAFKGLHSTLSNGHDTIFTVAFVGYLVVGTGSFLFHSTLKYPMQLVDELSMIYTTCIMFYATFAFGRSRGQSFLLATFLVALALFITLYYYYLQDPRFHQNAYALLTAIVLLRSIYIMERDLRPSRRKPVDAAEGRQGKAQDGAAAELQSRRDARDVAILRKMWTMIIIGLSVFLGGFALWNVDNVYCSQLRRWRRQVGLPWGIVLEGHGWWHLMTGIGAYFYITWGIWLRHCLNQRQDEFELHWPSRWRSFPTIQRVQHPSGDSANRQGQSEQKTSVNGALTTNGSSVKPKKN